MIWLTQWLCPSRHCSIALIWDPQRDDRDYVVERGEAIYAAQVVGRVCGICGSQDLHAEHGETQFRTMEEAEPFMRGLQQENDAGRKAVGDTNVDPEEAQRQMREILDGDGP